MALGASEQLFLELVNRARLDPLAEAARTGIDLNAGLAPGQLDGRARQVLAPDPALDSTAIEHSLWMLAADVFSHTGEGGSTVQDRILAGGYALEAPWAIGENLAWSGSTGQIDPDAAAARHHQQLYTSPGHRVNLMDGRFRETGIGQELGVFTQSGTDWNASMLTQVFALSADRQFVTGVVFADRDGDLFYDIGEGRGGAVISGPDGRATTAAAGGYALAVAADAAVALSLTLDGITRQVTVDTRPGNVKLDLLADGTILTSGSLALGAGALDARVLGAAGLALTGNAAANRLTGGAGDDSLAGGDGNDFLLGGRGHDRLETGVGNDTVWAGPGDDVVIAASGNNEVWSGLGNDTLTGGTGNDTLGAGGGDDVIDARAGGVNQLWAGAGRDTVYGADTGDQIGGAAGDDVVYAGAGADAIYLGAGNDQAYGGAGDDTFFAGPGFDRMWGGAGADRFEFYRNTGWNRVEDFTADDSLALARGLWQGAGALTAAQVVTRFGSVNAAGDAVLNFAAAETTIVITGAGTLDGLADQIIIL